MKRVISIALAGMMLFAFTQCDSDSGIKRNLPPPAEEQGEDITVKERNVMSVQVSADNILSVSYGKGEYKEIELTDLSNAVKQFITPRPNDESAPEVEVKNIELLGNVMVSQGIVSLKNERGTSFNTYIAVQDELSRAFNELRDEMAMKCFYKHFDQLTEEQAKAISEAIPVRISEAEPYSK